MPSIVHHFSVNTFTCIFLWLPISAFSGRYLICPPPAGTEDDLCPASGRLLLEMDLFLEADRLPLLDADRLPFV